MKEVDCEKITFFCFFTAFLAYVDKQFYNCDQGGGWGHLVLSSAFSTIGNFLFV